MGMVNVSNLGFGGSGVPDILPKAVAELQGMKMQFVDGAAAGTVIPVPGMDSEDHIGSVLNMTDSTTVDVSTLTVASRNAKATITCLTPATDGDSVTVNGKKYTIKDVVVNPSYNAPPFTVPIDIGNAGVTDVNKFAQTLAKAIMSGDSSLTAEASGAAVTVRVRQPGTAGNATTLAKTGTSVNISGATFAGGTAEGGSGFTSSASLAGKKLLVVWYDKNPGKPTAPLEAEAQSKESGKAGKQADKPTGKQQSGAPSNLNIKQQTPPPTAPKSGH